MEPKELHDQDAQAFEIDGETEQTTLPHEALDDDEGYVVEDAPLTISEY